MNYKIVCVCVCDILGRQAFIYFVPQFYHFKNEDNACFPDFYRDII